MGCATAASLDRTRQPVRAIFSRHRSRRCPFNGPSRGSPALSDRLSGPAGGMHGAGSGPKSSGRRLANAPKAFREWKQSKQYNVIMIRLRPPAVAHGKQQQMCRRTRPPAGGQKSAQAGGRLDLCLLGSPRMTKTNRLICARALGLASWRARNSSGIAVALTSARSTASAHNKLNFPPPCGRAPGKLGEVARWPKFARPSRVTEIVCSMWKKTARDTVCGAQTVGTRFGQSYANERACGWLRADRTGWH